MAGFNLSSFIPSVGSLGSFIKMLLWGSVIGGGITMIIILIRNKIKYQYRGEIFKRRQDDFSSGIPQTKYIEGKAGYFKKREKSIFRIKYGMMPWQQIELTKLPDPKYMVGNKVYYLQLNKDNLVQAKMDIDWAGGMSLEPVEDDLKYGAMLDIYEKDRILDTKRMGPLTVGLIVMGLVLVTGIIVFYFLGKV